MMATNNHNSSFLYRLLYKLDSLKLFTKIAITFNIYLVFIACVLILMVYFKYPSSILMLMIFPTVLSAILYNKILQGFYIGIISIISYVFMSYFAEFILLLSNSSHNLLIYVFLPSLFFITIAVTVTFFKKLYVSVTKDKERVLEVNSDLVKTKNKMRHTLLLLNEKNRLLEESTAKSAQIQNAVKHGLIILNKNLDVVEYNSKAEKFCSSQIDKLIQKPTFQKILSTLKKDPLLSINHNCEIKGKFYKIDVNPFLNRNDKKIYGYVISIYDLTKEKELDKLKTEFISQTTHELKTPLNTIKWSSELLKSNDIGTLNVSQREMVSQILKSNEKLIDLVNDLLEVSRIQENKIKIKKEPVAVIDLINSVLEEQSISLHEKKLNLSIDNKYHKSPYVSVDKKKMVQVFGNLISNAIKYTPISGDVSIYIEPKIHLQVEKEDLSGNYVVISIKDSGIGIPKNEQSKIFTKFYRGTNALKSEIGGTGLGLYITKKFVNLNQGKIWFKSEKDKGTTFYIALPIYIKN